jgi:hypothetical protein
VDFLSVCPFALIHLPYASCALAFSRFDHDVQNFAAESEIFENMGKIAPLAGNPHASLFLSGFPGESDLSSKSADPECQKPLQAI